jgi:type II secretory pathway pseudopilin PulG
MISPDPYVTPPLEWTEYTYDISSYSGQAIYIGIHMVSVDSWYLEIDDFQVTGSAGDVTPPVTTATLEGEQSGDVYTTDVTVTLTATDSGSGVNSTWYKIDAGSWTLYTAPFVVNGNGEHTVTFYSTDLAGNIETEKSVTFTIEYPLEVTVKGGMGVSITIKNVGSEPVTNVEWAITLYGGFSIKDKSLEGTILQIPADGTATKKLPVFGFGKTNISVVVNGVETTKSGFIFLFFVLGVK